MLGFGLGLNKWRRVGGGYVGLLDLFPNAAAAYSLRKLRAAYSGAAVRVRESGGNTEADIGFTSAGELDTAALLAHCGANDGFVTAWYDQSLSNNATQTTAASQPKIVNAGSLVTENGKVGLDFDGVDDYLTLGGTNDAGMLGDISVFSVNKNLGTSTSVVISTGLTNSSSASLMQWSLTGGTSNQYIGTTSDGTTRINENVTATNYGSQVLVSIINDESGNLQLFADGVGSTGQTAVAPMNDANYALQVGRDTFRASYNFSGTQQELILYASDQSSNRTGIETNINNFYSIYP